MKLQTGWGGEDVTVSDVDRSTVEGVGRGSSGLWISDSDCHDIISVRRDRTWSSYKNLRMLLFYFYYNGEREGEWVY